MEFQEISKLHQILRVSKVLLLIKGQRLENDQRSKVDPLLRDQAPDLSQSSRTQQAITREESRSSQGRTPVGSQNKLLIATSQSLWLKRRKSKHLRSNLPKQPSNLKMEFTMS